MPTLHQVMASLGVGGAKLTVQVEGSLHPRGAMVKGAVGLEGGRVEQRIRFIRLTIKEFWVTGSRRVSRERGVIHAASDVTIQPNQRLSFPFSFRMPDDMRLSSETAFGRPVAGCRIDAEAGVTFFYPCATAVLHVETHREVAAVLGAMRRIGFEESWAPHLFVPSAEITRIDYSVRGNLGRHLDGATIELKADASEVSGRLILNLREHSVAERIHALAGRDKVEIPIRIPSAQLLTPKGITKPEAAAAWLKQVLKDSMLLPDDTGSVLLRPAECPEHDILLRPAGAGGCDECNLLRPVPRAMPKSRRDRP